MEFKLKESWFWYFFSGISTGLLIFITAYAFTNPTTISSQALYEVLLLLFITIVTFILACKDKKVKPLKGEKR